VGKVNVPKLANYAEIDAFVLVACQQNSLMDSKEFYKPIVTPYELQLALSERDEWTGELKTDFHEVLPAIVQTASELEASADGGGDEDTSDAPFFSLVTGTYQNKSVSRAAAANTSLALEDGDTDAATALQVKNERSELTTYRSEAAEFLATREYRGLDPRLGETPAHAAVMGSTGIARGYDHEH
jgi:diphthamide biosynthesis protein 2